ncbi:MAG TPA: hypothetical protein VG844_10590 [Terracidiphilus sp.]|nr:hypothetical protein [Terracidiphilus sp.]
MPGASAIGQRSISRTLSVCQIAPSLCLLVTAFAFVAPAPVQSQAITIDTRTGTRVHSDGAPVDRRYAQITPTEVKLSKLSLNTKTKLELVRVLQADQGFAMRPFPRGHKGLTLEANGLLKPAGEDYVGMVTKEGLSAKPGDRLVITDVKVERNRIVFLLNGGPDFKHRFLRHIQLGTGTMTAPVVQDAYADQPMGARLTLEFKDGVPEMTGKDVKALLAPLISFDVKTPIQAFTDTLPPLLKNAILDHHVLVGMTTDMVLFAKGEPDHKMREMEGQMPFEEWIYGKPPKDVEFVRINGNRVIRVEIAKIGKPVEVFERDVVYGMMRTDGSPLQPGDPHGVRTVQMGDVHRDPDRQSPDAPPSLRGEGEALPGDAARDKNPYVMRPVQFPAQRPNDQPGYDTPADGAAQQPSALPDALHPASAPAQGAPATTQPQTTPPPGNPPAPENLTSTTPSQ